MKRLNVKKWIGRIALLLIAAGIVTYGLDDLIARVRHQPSKDVQIDRFLALDENFNRVGYEPLAPVTERCVEALLPHFGHNPCWWVESHKERFIKP